MSGQFRYINPEVPQSESNIMIAFISLRPGDTHIYWTSVRRGYLNPPSAGYRYLKQHPMDIHLGNLMSLQVGA